VHFTKDNNAAVISLTACGCADPAAKKVKDFSRRTSSGNWINDRVTWKEELNYKKAMGYI